MNIRWHKSEHYVLVRWYEDLAGDWVIEKVVGKSPSSVEQIVRHTPLAYRESKLKFRQISNQLRGQGFQPLKDDEVQLGFEF
ncbi:MAG: hypothetical protein ACPGPF_07800 [Pontibacterium sp.]